MIDIDRYSLEYYQRPGEYKRFENICVIKMFGVGRVTNSATSYSDSGLPFVCLRLQVTLTGVQDFHLYLSVGMSNIPPGKQSKKSRLLLPFKDLFSRIFSRSPSPSRQGAQSLTPDTAIAISASPTDNATSVPKLNPQSPQTAHSSTPDKATASISILPIDSITSAPQVNPRGTDYTAILELSSTPLTWEHRMKEYGSSAYEGLKVAIQGVYDCSSIFPLLQATAGVLLTISKVVDVRGSVLNV